MERKDYVIVITVVVISIVFMNIMIGSSCVFRILFGIPCPGCGLTRACMALLHGDVNTAFRYHPLFWAVPFLGFPLIHMKRYKHLAGTIFIITIALFLAVWVYRICNIDNFRFL